MNVLGEILDDHVNHRVEIQKGRGNTRRIVCVDCNQILISSDQTEVVDRDMWDNMEEEMDKEWSN